MKDIKGACQAVVLAAGKSTRFGTGRSKLLEPLCGKPLICYTLDTLVELGLPIILVVGHESDRVCQVVQKRYPHHPIEYITQAAQSGTGDALLTALPYITSQNFLVVNGDMPFVSTELIEKLLDEHEVGLLDVSFVGAYVSSGVARGYGRILFENKGHRVIEERDFVSTSGFSKEQSAALACNAGIYLFSLSFAKKAVSNLQASKATGEFYITSLIEHARKERGSFCLITDFDTIRGVNTLQELAQAEYILLEVRRRALMNQGVRIDMAHTVYVEDRVVVSAGCVIGAGVKLHEGTVIV